MQTISEYPLTMQNQILVLPGDFQILSISVLNGIPTLFVLCGESDFDDMPIKVSSYSTGCTLPTLAKLHYIDSLQWPDGMVDHYFYEFV